jgi:cyclic pyranopterin phosphate synthase
MTPQEIHRITQAAARLGASKVKITGGEPLMRNDLATIVSYISRIREIQEISVVTNATLLNPKFAKELRRCGLKRINVNLPSIESATYRRLTGGDLSKAQMGILAARSADISPIKINMLLLAGENDDQVDSMIEFAKSNGLVLQLIELEPLQISPDYYARHHIGLETIEKRIMCRATSVKEREHMQGRKVFSLPGIDVEIVRPVENTEFCLHCTRMRLTSDGKVKPCLMRQEQLVDLLPLLRSRATDAQLEKLMAEAVRERTPFYCQPSLLT